MFTNKKRIRTVAIIIVIASTLWVVVVGWSNLLIGFNNLLNNEVKTPQKTKSHFVFVCKDREDFTSSYKGYKKDRKTTDSSSSTDLNYTYADSIYYIDRQVKGLCLSPR